MILSLRAVIVVNAVAPMTIGLCVDGQKADPGSLSGSEGRTIVKPAAVKLVKATVGDTLHGTNVCESTGRFSRLHLRVKNAGASQHG